MHFVAHALDRPETVGRRKAVLSAHRAYLDAAPTRLNIRVLLSGPLTAYDGETMIGSFFLLEAPSRKSAEALFASDPMKQAGVWDSFDLHAVTLRQNAMPRADHVD